MSFHFPAPYLDTLGVDYGAGVNVVDFANYPERARMAINNEVMNATQQTRSSSPRMRIDLGNTRLVLTNSVYMKASWDQPFRKEGTSGSPRSMQLRATSPSRRCTTHGAFRTSKTPMYQMIALDYDGKKVLHGRNRLTCGAGQFCRGARRAVGGVALHRGHSAKLAPAAVSLGYS